MVYYTIKILLFLYSKAKGHITPMGCIIFIILNKKEIRQFNCVQ